jgi:short subunit dehydrogenase-like uncharacterized protein
MTTKPSAGSTAPTRQKFDLVVYGASSFVGQILCRYLLQRFGVDGGLRWALAGRSQSKLDAVKLALGPDAAALKIMLADASDDAALTKMCRATRTIVSTVGPYALYGEALVRACVETGTDYCDLTGEPQWIRQMLARYEAAAVNSGARIVHSCGFDSIPSDLGVDFLQRECVSAFGEPAVSVKMRVKALRGGLSGGTAASLMNAVREATRSAEVRRELANPYSLCTHGSAPKTRQPNLRGAAYDPDFNAWLAPFVMAAINTRIVQRSHALQGRPWGEDFRYDEATLFAGGLKGRASASLMAAGLGGFMLASALPPIRFVLERFVLPAAGEGPSAKSQERGLFELHFFGRTRGGKTLRVNVSGDRDPGYGSTAKMLGEAAAMLALDCPKKALKGGFWTPATAFGQGLTTRLIQHAGLRFELMSI